MYLLVNVYLCKTKIAKNLLFFQTVSKVYHFLSQSWSCCDDPPKSQVYTSSMTGNKSSKTSSGSDCHFRQSGGSSQYHQFWERKWCTFKRVSKTVSFSYFGFAQMNVCKKLLAIAWDLMFLYYRTYDNSKVFLDLLMYIVLWSMIKLNTYNHF